MPNIVSLDRLKSQLLTSGIQQQNIALYQVINQLIDALRQAIDLQATQVNDIISSGPSTISGPVGPPGLDGFDGVDGEIGPPGRDGIQGPQGSAGQSNIPGIDGIDGESPEEFYLGIQGILGESILWTDVAYASGDFTGNGAMTWTVDSGDLTEFKFAMLNRETMIIQFTISTSSIGGTPSTPILIKIPNGRTVAMTQSINAVVHINDNGTRFQGFVQGRSGTNPTRIEIYKNDVSNFTASTNNTGVYGTIILKVL